MIVLSPVAKPKRQNGGVTHERSFSKPAKALPSSRQKSMHSWRWRTHGESRKIWGFEKFELGGCLRKAKNKTKVIGRAVKTAKNSRSKSLRSDAVANPPPRLRFATGSAVPAAASSASTHLVGEAVPIHVTELSGARPPLVPEAAEVGGSVDVGDEGGGLDVAGRVDAHRQQAAADLGGKRKQETG